MKPQGSIYEQFYEHFKKMMTKKRKPTRWKMAEGESIHIVDMTDDHLRNTVRMIDRRERARALKLALYKEIKAEARRRGII